MPPSYGVKMITNLLLLSTCGTSVLTNGSSEQERRWLHNITNLSELNPADKAQLESMVQDRSAQLVAAGVPDRRRLSAELNGAYAALDRWPAKKVTHLLVHTDTAAGGAVAEMMETCLRGTGSVAKLSASGLRTDDVAAFRDALSQLTLSVEEFVATGSQGWDQTIFNLTGGFKSVNAYLQALGMLYADRCVFLFEGAGELMEIPRLPVRLAEKEEVGRHLKAFRRMVFGYDVTLAEVNGLSPFHYTEVDGAVGTSFWGDMVWGRVRKELLAHNLLEPLSPKLDVSNIGRDFAGLDSARRLQVNHACDALSAYLDGKRPITKANTFKPVNGAPTPPSTHELYIWNDQDAWRLFGHFEESKFVADRLGKHL